MRNFVIGIRYDVVDYAKRQYPGVKLVHRYVHPFHWKKREVTSMRSAKKTVAIFSATHMSSATGDPEPFWPVWYLKLEA